MKFQPDTLDGVNVITRQEPGRIWLGPELHMRSVLVPWVGAVQPWPALAVQDLTEGHFRAILALKPEVVIFGSGARIQFVAPGLMRALIDQRIGVETMDTPAACRTYNVLVSEHRAVVAALLLQGPPGPL
jgi:uncharacterized protein